MRRRTLILGSLTALPARPARAGVRLLMGVGAGPRLATFVQNFFAQDISGSNITSEAATLTATKAGGDYLVGLVYWYGNGVAVASTDLSSISDGTNTYTTYKFISGTDSGSDFAIVLFAGPCATGKTTLTASFSKGVSYPLIMGHEVKGVSSVGNSNTSILNAPSSPQSISISVPKAAYVYGVGITVYNTFSSLSIGSPFTAENSDGPGNAIDGYLVETSATTQSATFTFSPTGTSYDLGEGIIALVP
jgi:hypothetical protein